MPNDPQPSGEFLLYTTEDGKSRVECRFEYETIWLSQALMADLFKLGVDGYDQENLGEMNAWFLAQVPKVESAFKEPIAEAGQKLKPHSFTSPEEGVGP